MCIYLTGVRGQQETLHVDEYCHLVLNVLWYTVLFLLHSPMPTFILHIIFEKYLGCLGLDSKRGAEMQLPISTVHDFTVSLRLPLSNYRENFQITLFSQMSCEKVLCLTHMKAYARHVHIELLSPKAKELLGFQRGKHRLSESLRVE